MLRTKTMGVSLLAVPLALAVGCGGGDSPEDEIATVAKGHLVALSEFNAEGICGPVGSEAAEEIDSAAESNRESNSDDWDSDDDLPTSCEEFVAAEREDFESAEGLAREIGISVQETIREVDFDQVTIDPGGISATVLSKPFTIENPEDESQKVSRQYEYSMTKENGAWLVNGVVVFDEGADPEEDGDEIWPDY